MTTRHPEPARRGRAWVTALLVLAAFAAGGAVGVFVFNRPRPDPGRPEPGGTPTDRPLRVTALGRLQPAGGVIPVAGPPGDRIEKLEPVAPGTPLKEGQPIATLASHTERELEVKVARQQFAEAEEQLAKAKAAGEKKIAVARAEAEQALANRESDLAALQARVSLAETQAATAARAVERLTKLRAEGVRVADEDLERARLQKAQADAEVAAANAALRKAETTYAEGEKAAQARIAAAEAELAEAVARVPIESARQRLALAEQVLSRTVLKAPVSGIVLSVHGREGQPTGLEPILRMADLGQMIAVAEVYEADVERLLEWVRQGPVPAEVTNPALPRPLRGAVRSEADVARVIARNQVLPVGPREDADRRVVEVVVHLDTASAKDAARFVGLQVTVSLSPGK
jgi:HlyD family secretion protein